MDRTIRLLIAVAVVVAASPQLFDTAPASAQQPTEYNGVEFPQGDISFADRVVSYEPGAHAIDDCVIPSKALGIPDHQSGGTCVYHVALGNAESTCEASLVLEFVDNYLVDVDGDDLYIFEVGVAVEATELSISQNGSDWLSIGRIEGSTRGVDIADFVGPNDRFSFVRLCDAVDGATSGTPYGGPDIDAVGAIGAQFRPESERTTESNDENPAQPSGTATPVPGGTGHDPNIPGDAFPPPTFPAPQPTDVDRMTLQAGQRQVVAGGFVWVPVYLLRSGNVANINFEIEYGSSVAIIEGDPVQGNLLSSHAFRANAGDPGIVRVGIAGTSGIVGSGTVAWLPFRAVGQPGDSTQLTVTISTINTPDGSTPAIDRIHGRIIITDQNGQVPGDCNGDATLNEFDAYCALEMSVELRAINLVLDMDGDGQVTSRDATLILQRVLGLT